MNKNAVLQLANQRRAANDGLGVVIMANAYRAAGENETWVQLSPFGVFPNKMGIQRFNAADALNICNEFSTLAALPQRTLGLPFYIGHPDHPSFKEQYKDTKSYGRIKELACRHDADCVACADFVNEQSETPCVEHGLFGRVKWNEDGLSLIANESFHGHSVNWRLRSVNGEWHPFSLKSVGFTNEPNIQVAPILAANEIELELASRRFCKMSVMRKEVAQMANVAVKGYRRVLPSGKVVMVRDYTDSRQAAADRSEMIHDAEADLAAKGIKNATAKEIADHVKANHGVSVPASEVEQRIKRLAKMRKK